MTLLMSWIGCDPHGTTSAYIMSESRVSWNNKTSYDSCRKVFCSKLYPDIIGYCGEVLFPSIVINQMINIIDMGLLFNTTDSCNTRFEIFKNKFITEFRKYPKENANNTLQLVYINRDIGEKHYLKFYCNVISYCNGKWSFKQISIPTVSDVLTIHGSGKLDFIENYKQFQKGKNKNTSRNAYHCFIYTLERNNDDSYGGAPQLIGLYRKPKSVGINFGIIYKRKRYILGTQVTRGENFDIIEWRNRNFEICSGKTKQKKLEAISQQFIPISTE